MSSQETRKVLEIAGSLIIYPIYCLLLYQQYLKLSPAPGELLFFWGSALLIMIPVQIFPKLIIHLILSLLKRPETGEADKLLELKVLKNGYIFFVAGFLLSMVPLLMGRPISAMFIILLLSMAGSCIFTDISAIYLYRREANKHQTI